MVQTCQESLLHLLSEWNANDTLLDESVLASLNKFIERDDPVQDFLSILDQSANTLGNGKAFLQQFTKTSLRMILFDYNDLLNDTRIMALLSQLIESCEKYSILEAVLCLTEQLLKQKYYSIREDTMLYFIQLLEISANNFFGCPENFQMSDVIGNKLLEITAVCNIVDLDTSCESNVRLSIFLWKVSFYRRTHSNSHFADQNFTRIGNISVKHKEIAKLLPVNQNIFIETRRQLTKFCEQLQRYILSSTDCQDEKCIQLHQTSPKCSIPTHDVLQSRLKLTRFLHRAFHKQILNHLEFSSQSLIQVRCLQSHHIGSQTCSLIVDRDFSP